MKPDALAKLHSLCFVTPRPWSAREFAGLLEMRGVFLIGDTKGFVLGRAIAGEAELLTLAVAPDRRRMGVGNTLLRDYETESLNRGATDSFLEVAQDNKTAIALYQMNGYAQTGRRRDYYRTPAGTPRDAILLSKRLIRL